MVLKRCKKLYNGQDELKNILQSIINFETAFNSGKTSEILAEYCEGNIKFLDESQLEIMIKCMALMQKLSQRIKKFVVDSKVMTQFIFADVDYQQTLLTLNQIIASVLKQHVKEKPEAKVELVDFL